MSRRMSCEWKNALLGEKCLVVRHSFMIIMPLFELNRSFKLHAICTMSVYGQRTYFTPPSAMTHLLFFKLIAKSIEKIWEEVNERMNEQVNR